jgi:ABC-2 type transport system ATP-binding protein
MAEPLRLLGVSKRYAPRSPWVLRGVDLELPPGSFTRIDGANGSGKSTLLALIAGISRPSRGRVMGGGRAAYVPERLPAVLPYDVTGYLDRLGAVHGLSLSESRRRAAHWLDLLGAATWARAPMASLSQGTTQKVALAQAFMADADLLVLDEAWTGLDAITRTLVDQAVHDRVAAGATVVYVDHNHGGRQDPSTDVYQLQGGRVIPLPRDGQRQWLAFPAASSPDLVEIEFEIGGQHQTVQVAACDSDDALRRILSLPQHHVRSVRSASPPA